MREIILIILFLNISLIYSQTADRNQNTSLMVANTISVTLGGQFPLTGTFPASVTERVDQFVTRIYSQALERSLRTATDQVMLEKIKQELSDFSLRGILLKKSKR